MSESFILNEIIALIDLGLDVSILSLMRPSEKKMHEEIMDYDLINKTKYFNYFSGEGAKSYTSIDIFKKGIIQLFWNKTVHINEKIQLLSLSFKNKMGVETAVRRFLDYMSIATIIKEKKIKHIHCHFAGQNVGIAYIINQALRIPYTFTTHAYDIFIDPSKDIVKWANASKGTITISEFNKKYMFERLGIPLEKTKIVTYGIYLEKLNPVLEYKTDPFRIISISRLAEKKGYPYLIEACKILKERGVEFICEIQGDGPARPKFERMIKENNLEKEIKLGSALTRQEVSRFISTGSVFVLPCIRASNNDMDGIPNVLMEAMAMEIPVISTKMTGIPELIDNGIDGVIVPPNDSYALAEAILKIKTDKVFSEKIRKNGRKKIEDKFNINTNIKKLIRVFEI